MTQPSLKRAALVAGQIEDLVISRGWPTGAVLGSEEELAATYGVSRAVLREAVRLLEHQRVVVAKRGRNGGIAVQSSPSQVARGLVRRYIDFADISLRELHEIRRPLELLAVRLAAENIDEDGIERLRHLLLIEDADSTPRPLLNVHRALVEASGSPALHVLLDAVLTAIWDRVPVTASVRRSDRMHDAHGSIVEAVIAGHVADAEVRMRVHLDALASYSTPTGPEIATPTFERGADKLPERLAQAIARAIHADGCKVGDMLGSEAALLGRYGVSRGVLREAVRILESHGVADMRRGPGGGLMVGEARPDRAAEAVRRYLDVMSISAGQLSQIRHVVEAAMVEIATGRLGDGGRRLLARHLDEEDLQRGGAQLAIGYDFHRLVARLTNNRGFELLCEVLSSIQGARVGGGDDAERLLGEMHHAHRRIAAAMIDGDPAVARHRMSRHLQEGVDPLVGSGSDPRATQPSNITP